MTNKEKLTRLVIEAIHWLPYENAIMKEIDNLIIAGQWVEVLKKRLKTEKWRPITIWRVMQAVSNINSDYAFKSNWYIMRWQEDAGMFDMYRVSKIKWEQKGEIECTIEDQSEETINELIKLLQN